MNTIWSTYIQKTGTLYYSRLLRFSDFFKEKYINSFMIEEKKRILEIGCGPGALTQSLFRWYPNAQIFGVDRDSGFIDFARKQAPYIHFSEDDVTNLNFENESFDVTISNTVVEHIDPSKFYGEQYRVLKKNGICLVLSARKGINITAPCIAEESEFESDIWKRTETYFAEAMEKYHVCCFPQTEAEIPMYMEKYGFRDVTTEYITVNLTPDAPIYSRETAHAMINANRQASLDGVDCLPHIAADVVTPSEIEELKTLIHAKYDKRLELYDKGIRQWDTNMSVTMIVRGRK